MLMNIYVQIYVSHIISNNEGGRKFPPNLILEEDAMENPFDITLFYRMSASKNQNISFIRNNN